MNTMVTLPTGGFRDSEAVQVILQSAQSRHLNGDEQQQYLDALPAEQGRLNAAKEVADVQDEVVGQTVREILSIYPFKHFHDAGPEKCMRDVGYVLVYATHAMLCNDTEWLKDKFLYWMRTMIHAFGFPQAASPEDLAEMDQVPNPFPDVTQQATAYAPEVQSIYDTYTRLRRHLEEHLSPAAWAYMDEPLRVVVEVLAPKPEQGV